MDERIVNILNILDTDNSLSQRELSKKTNISLGTVNSLINHCVSKGLVKVKKLNPRNIQYILTYDGMKALTKRSISYIQKSYQAILEIQDRVREIAEEKIGQGKKIVLLAEEDEIYQLAVNTLKESKIGFQHIRELEELAEEKDKLFVIYWDPDYCPEDIGVESINIFSKR